MAYISEATLPSESTNSTQGNQSTILGGAILSESKDTTTEPQKQEVDEKISDSVSLVEDEIRFRSTEITEEEQIIADAKANGAYLKAPNGKKSNLTPKQWAQVRTKAFKKWFGDWEKAARIEKLRKSKDAKITGNEIEASEDLKQYKKNAQMYGRTLQGEYTNADTGAVIFLQRGRHNGGINEVLQHNYKDVAHLQSVAAIPQIIENGIYIESQLNKDTDTNPDVKEYQMFVCGLKIGGEDYTVLAKVAVDSKGNRYYDHNLVSVEKGKLIDIANNEQSAISSGFGTTPDTKSTTNSQRKYKELISLLQTNSSKVVDANGEPKVVWHGTINSFNKFDRGKLAVHNGFYFSNQMGHASKFAGPNGVVMPVFLQIKNPKRGMFRGAGIGADMGYSDVFDGGIFTSSENSRYANKDTQEIIVFDPNQIKSATDNIGTFDPSNDDIRFRSTEQPTPIFYSNAEYAVKGVKQEKATPEQWLKMIEKNGGLKAGEDKWLGLSDWLKSSDKKTLTKQEVLDFIKENQIQIEEVEYVQGIVEDDGIPEYIYDGFEVVYNELRDERDFDSHEDLVEYAWSEYCADAPNWVREAIEAIAYSDGTWDLKVVDSYIFENNAISEEGDNAINSTRLDYTTNGLENKREIALTVPTIEPWNQSDEVHFGDAGNGRAIAWVRFGETTDADGNRVLVIDEVQSKRHQEGREKGYISDEVLEAQRQRNYLYDKMYREGLSEDELNRYHLLGEYIKENYGIIPSAPFEKNWAELAMKRMLRYAAENGFDKIAWTTGEQQANRYDLSKSVDVINAEQNEDGTYNINVATVDDSYFIQENNISESRLAELVGKDMALSIVKATQESEDGKAEIEGDNLRIGGSGMKAFYDQMIPSFMNKYGKKWGVKVGEVTMPNLEENNTMHSIDVTDAMRESVMQGQPMFRSSNTNYESQFANLQSEYDALDKNDAEALNAWRDKKADVVRSYVNWVSDKFGLKCELYVFNGSREEEMRKVYDTMVEKYKANGIENIPSYESFKEKVTNPKVVATHRKRINFVTFNTSADDAELDIDQFAETLFHENAHRIAQGMYSKQEFEQIWENAKKSKNRIAKSVEKLYSGKNDAQKGNEFIAKAIGELVRNHKQLFTKFLMDKGDISADDLVKKLKYSLPLGKLALTETLNEFRNEYRERVLQGSGSSILGGSRDGGDFEVSEGDGGRNSRGNWKGESRRLRVERGRDVVKAATDLASSLGVKLNVIEDVNEITDPNNRMQRAKRDAKAWYDVKTDQVYFVAPNATSIADAQESVLHEVVAHKGLRDVVGRENFNRFLDKVFQSAAPEIRTQIVSLAAQNRWDFRVATEEYLASLAEEGFDSRENRTFWQKVRDLFMDMLHEAKIALGYNINDNDMRYMLWRTYQMQRSQGAMAVAEDIVMQQKMGVGYFRTRPMTEEEQIIADAKANGAYLKAPNGKKSNLTPKQWAQVRTKAFKKWFGDWEKAARIEKLRKSKDAKITGNEIEASEDLKQYRKNAQEYGKTLRGEYVNADTGNSIILNKDSLKEVLHHDGSNIAHIQSIAAIPQMIENGIYITSESVEENASKRMRNAKSVHYYVCGLKIGNTPYTVKFVIAEYANGDRYYDHSLTQIEKGDLLNRAELSSTVAESKSPISDIKDKRLISILQTNSSKVVDANGEPKVVYHRTSNEFTTFDTEKIGSSTDWGAFGMGFYFSPNSERYGLYGNNEMALFLNAQNPLMLDNSNAYDMKEPFFKDGSWDKEASEDFTKWVKDNGYDAVVYKTDLNEEVVVFEPNQIKSATDNIGTFDPSNDDIRFRSTEITEEERVNARFNEELNELTEDNARERILNVGMPSPILRASGIENKPIRLYGAKLLSKVRKHGYKLSDLQNLPSALNNPIAVFKGSHDGSFAILTELAIGNNNVLATLSIGKGSHDVDFNIISSVYDKRSENVLRWINDGKLLYVDKEKALNYFSVSAPVAEAQSNQGLSSVTKIIENFVNPTIEDTKNEPNGDILFRSDRPKTPERNVPSVRKKYEKKVNTGRKGTMKATKYNFIEAMQDEMRSLKEYQEIVKEAYGLDEIPPYLDAYMRENQIGSAGFEKFSRFEDGEYEDMMTFIDDYIQDGETLESVIAYARAKSGLERNREFTVRDYIDAMAKEMVISKAEAEEQLKQVNDDLRNDLITPTEADARRQQINNLRSANKLNEEQVQALKDDYTEKRDAYRKLLQNGMVSYADFNRMSDALAEKFTGSSIKDYSGLSTTATNMGREADGWRDVAASIVEQFEQKHRNTDAFWGSVNKCNDAVLAEAFDSGMLNRKLYDHLKQQFLWYIPMSGFTEDTAEDVYSYIGAETGAFTPTVKKAAGRLSESDDPFAIIGNKMQSAILQGNRNRIKQTFLNFVQAYPTDLITVGSVWFKKQADDSWVINMLEIPEGTSAEEAAKLIEEHNKEMRELRKQGLAREQRNKLNVPYVIETKSHKNDHEIVVHRNGRPIVLYVNGNPQLAKAINGKLKDKSSNMLFKAMDRINRWMSANKTSYNPDFIPTNMMRDLEDAVLTTFIDAGVEDAAEMAATFIKVFPEVVRSVSGSSNTSRKYHDYFEEFLRNGGETGYSHIRDVEKWKDINKRRWKRVNGAKAIPVGASNAVSAIGSMFSYMNRIAEDSTRFAAYVYNRGKGKSIAESIAAAKNISTNFNKKGSGATEGIWGFAANFLRRWLLFFNPMVQGMYKHKDKIKNNSKRYSLVFTTLAAMGYVAAALNAKYSDDDDEEKKYLNQTDYTRRNNVMIYTGDGYVKIPLAPVFREMYAIGDIVYCVVDGKLTPWEGTKEVINLVRGLFKLEGQSSLEGQEYSVLRTVLPESVEFIADIEDNTTFTGTPLYKAMPYNKNIPEYQKVYKGTWKPLIEISKLVNSMLPQEDYLTEVNDQMAGRGSSKWINPAVWQHAIEEISGGTGKFIGDVVNIASNVADGENVDMYNIPIGKRFYAKPDERTRGRILKNRYYEAIDELERMNDRFKKYINSIDGIAEKAEKTTQYWSSDAGKRHDLIKKSKSRVEKLRKEANNAMDEAIKEQKTLEMEAAMAEFLEKLKELDSSNK